MKTTMTKKSQGYKGRVDTKVCTYCGDPINSASASSDHLIPESKGGIRAKDNMVPSCHQCNMMKGDMDVAEFKKFLERMIGVEYTMTKIKTGYFKKVALSCRNIIMQSTPRNINFNNGETKDSQ